MSNVGGLLVGFSTRFFFPLRFQTFIANDESSYSYGSPFMTKVTLFSFHFLWLLVNESFTFVEAEQASLAVRM